MKNRQNKELYSRGFKLKFMGYGDWLDEPDEVIFEYRGIKCLVFRMVKRESCAPRETYFGGHLCGYVWIPKGHSLYGMECWDMDLECYQGLTFQEETDDGWLVGFDCAHSGDLIPTLEHMRNTDPEMKKIKEIYPPPEGFEKHPWFYPTYKSVDFCIKECKSLAKQVAKMMVQA